MKWDGSEFEDSLRRLAKFGLDNCIGANDCMKKCPVNRLEVNQNELDSVFVSGAWTERVQTFVTERVQCGDCTLACPAGVHRDHMMLMLKAMLPTIPKQWEQYYALKGRRDRSWLISLYDVVIRIAAGPMGKHIDKARLEQKPLLFTLAVTPFRPPAPRLPRSSWPTAWASTMRCWAACAPAAAGPSTSPGGWDTGSRCSLIWER